MILYLFILEYHVAHVSLRTVFETGLEFSQNEVSGSVFFLRVSGSDFVETFKSRSRIFKQGSWHLGESRILAFATPVSKCSSRCGCGRRKKQCKHGKMEAIERENAQNLPGSTFRRQNVNIQGNKRDLTQSTMATATRTSPKKGLKSKTIAVHVQYNSSENSPKKARALIG